MTRLWRQGAPIDVVVNDQARPLRFVWSGKPHVISRIIQQWEVDSDWWEATGRIWRAYYAAVTEDGLLCVLYQDLPTGAWFVSKLYD
jgi:hypothetical protein